MGYLVSPNLWSVGRGLAADHAFATVLANSGVADLAIQTINAIRIAG
jgi:hypothetical protein